MRQICLDTETTGLDAKKGDRLIEIGCYEIIGRTISDNEKALLHLYINPEREVPEEAVAIHGITNEFLADKPVFADVVDRFLEFVSGAELIIHNAEFDVGFINMELKRLKRGKIEDYCPKITDSLEMAKKIFVGLRNNLDALCGRYGIDNSERTLHGALLDAELLAEVYLAMTRQQGDLFGETYSSGEELEPIPSANLFAKAATPEDEMAVHRAFLERMQKSKGGCRWLQETAATEEK